MCNIQRSNKEAFEHLENLVISFSSVYSQGEPQV